jgi:cysteine desulfurase family protein
MIYLDNAATSYPKPETVYAAMDDFLRHHAGNPGRSGHRLAVAAQRVVEDARRDVAALLGVAEPERIAFALNTTDALNMALKGTLRPGDHAIATSMEHNAVVRPLTRLVGEGVTVTFVPCDGQGLLDPAEITAAFTPQTRLVVVNHASNVTGGIQPVAEVGALIRERGALLLLDAAQTAGAVPLDVEALQADLVAFPGHKSLLGPPGTGGLYVGPRADVRSFREGGTGSASESPEHPRQLPERLEAGTHNSAGLAGLAAGLRFLRETGLDHLRAHEQTLSAALWDGLADIAGVRLYGPPAPEARTSVVSFTLDHWEPTDLGAILDSAFDLAVRPGLHCAPLAHRTLGTLPGGTVRMSCGYFNTLADVDAAVAAIAAIAGS